jgi:diadenosine tetraphosphate (Ap4A) HIT family hydrolase
MLHRDTRPSALGSDGSSSSLQAASRSNYELLGNAVPHLHTHLVPRYIDDIAPGRPMPSEAWQQSEQHPVPESQLRADVEALVDAV